MSQTSDMVVPNTSGAGVRSAINARLQAITTQQSGAAAPSTTYPFQEWADTATGLRKQRNAANTDWVVIGKLGVEYLGHQRMTKLASIQPTGNNATFSNIPDWAKKITVSFGYLSTTGSSPVYLRIGAEGTVLTTGYSSATAYFLSNGTINNASYSSGFGIPGLSPVNTRNGMLTLSQLTKDNNSFWTCALNGVIHDTAAAFAGGGIVSLGNQKIPDSVIIATGDGADTFDSGIVTVICEGYSS